MPRVAIKRDEYKVNDFTSKVKGKCAEKGLKMYQLADLLDISAPALTQKMQQGSYSLKDFLKIVEVLKFTDEELTKLVR